jgi:acetyl-CoA C-acetyltransferase
MLSPEFTPVIVGVGELTERRPAPGEAREPVGLMEAALRDADADAGGGWLDKLESVSLIGLISWHYRNPVSLLCERLGIQPASAVNASMGGETPVRLLHEAALSIARGEITAAAIVGGEALAARNQARKSGWDLGWTTKPPPEEAVRFPSSSFAMSPVARSLGVVEPAQIYPFYEMATQAAWDLTPAEADKHSAGLWARYAAVAATQPHAWIQTAADADFIATVTPENRLINWPYPKLMTANPNVNQSAAVIVASLAAARAAGLPEERIVHIWGGAAAREPEDYLQRDRYDHSAAQTAVLEKAVRIGGGDARAFDRLELYSCFPVVPKMALRTLGLGEDGPDPTVAGGPTFFGGPLNNYMTHAVCAMVRTLRAHPGELGLLYGQGGFVNKHHALVLSTAPPPEPIAADPSVQAEADAARGAVPALVADYEGPACIETYTVRFGRDGEPIDGIVILRTPDGARCMARVQPNDTLSLAPLLSRENSAIGLSGWVKRDVFGKPAWRSDAAVAQGRPPYRFCTVEREGRLTLVTINRPEVMNAVHPAANAELAEIFDDFAADPDQWVAILTGAGDRAFSAGNDLKWTAQAMAKRLPIETPLTGYAGLTARFGFDKPVIAAVNGVAMGGGFEIALACDLIIAADSAMFALPEPKVGLAALEGGLLRLPRQIGRKAALGMILTGRSVSAAEGQTMGFVNEVVPAAELMTAARRWAADILACSPMSIRASKALVEFGLNAATVEQAYREQASHPAAKALFRSADMREGPLAFAQKRPPHWKGR